MMAHDLCACNTWTKDVPAATFQFGQSQSQIDFVMLRRSHTSAWSRQSRSFHGFPVGGWRSGALHFPVLACLWKPWARSSTSNRVDVQAIINVELRRLAQSEVIKNSTMQQMDRALQDKLQVLFPMNKQVHTPVWRDSILQYNSSQAWRHFRSAKCQPRTLAGFVQAWKHVTQFRKWHKQCMQRGRMARKERLLRTLHEAQLAAEKHDHWRLYQIVRRLAPKQWSSKLQLKVAGRLLSVLEEMSVIHQHFQDLFNPAECLAPSVRSLATAKHVDSLEVLRYLQCTPMRKAASRNGTPGCVYRICAQELHEWLCTHLRQMWGGGPLQLPVNWKVVDLILLNKPGTSGHDIKRWRPSGLQHPVSKCVLNLLLDEARPYISRLVSCALQYAYHPGRSTEDALKRVFSHCHEVRQACRDGISTVGQDMPALLKHNLWVACRYAWTSPQRLTEFPGSPLEEALALAELPDDLRHRLMRWLEDSRLLKLSKRANKDAEPRHSSSQPTLLSFADALMNGWDEAGPRSTSPPMLMTFMWGLQCEPWNSSRRGCETLMRLCG